MQVRGNKHLHGAMVAAVTVVAFLVGPASAERPKTLAYDGFNTGSGAGSYNANQRPYGGAPTLNTVGFDDRNAWDASTSHYHPRPANMRELKHNLLESAQPGSLGHWVFNGVRSLRRNLSAPPVAKSGVYTQCLLYCAWSCEKFNKPEFGNHTTGTAGTYGMIGFTPETPIPHQKATTAEFGDNGKKGLSLGYYEKTLRVFAGGKSFVIVEDYKQDTTYLLMAEMTVSKDGPEHIKGFYAASGDKELTPAKFNSENGGKGVEVETWSSPEDLVELEIYTSDYDKWIPGKEHFADPMSSAFDKKKTDFLTWDEVRLMDGHAVVPVPGDELQAAGAKDSSLIAKKELPPKLAAYWAFDEGSGGAAKDSVGNAHGKLVQSSWVKDGVFGSAMRFATQPGPKYGPHHAEAVSIPHKAGVDADVPWERFHKLTFSAWVRGGDDFKGIADILTKANGASVAERSFADIKGLAFMIQQNKLELELVNSINFPQPDMRIKVRGKPDVPGDNQWHHVAVTYDGSSKPSGVTFYVDGVQSDGFSFNFATLPNQPQELTADIGITGPYCIGGRARESEKDGVSASGCNYGMAGDIDEIGAFTYVLSPGEVVAIHGLAKAGDLKYNLGQVNQLIEMYRKKSGNVTTGGRTWEYAAGLKGELGKPVQAAGRWSVKLADDGSGVQTK